MQTMNPGNHVPTITVLQQEANPSVLSDPHRNELVRGSGISGGVIQARRYRTVTDPKDLTSLGFSDYQAALVPGLLVPVIGPDGKESTYQFKPDKPRTEQKEGKPPKSVKYETVQGSSVRADFAPAMLEHLSDTSVPVLITEGVKKGDSLASWCERHNYPLLIVALMGVWCFRKEASADLDRIVWDRRTVYLAFDSDAMTKPEVKKALKGLGADVRRRGGIPKYVILAQQEGGGTKVGLDDFLVSDPSKEGLLHALESAGDALPEDEADKTARLVAELAELDPIPYDKRRKETAEALGCSVGAVDKQVKEYKAKNKGGGINIPEVEPWPEPVNGAGLLDAVVSELRRFLVLPEHGAETLALWATFTFIFSRYRWAPKIGLVSPERQCGKSVTLSVLGLIANRSRKIDGISPAALFRFIELAKPTLLMDEMDTYGTGDKSEDVRGILNSSSERGARVTRCNTTACGEITLAEFDVYTPIAYARIKDPWDTVADRSIILRMRRKAAGETTEPMANGAHEPAFSELRRKIARFIADNADQIEGTDVPRVAGISDRANDNWRPLLAIASVAGSHWPETAEAAALALSGGERNESVGEQLLQDIRRIFTEEGLDMLHSVTLCERLVANEESPWGDRRGRGPIKPRDLARLLKGYSICSETLRIEGTAAKGYRASAFADAFTRYLPSSSTPETSVASVASVALEPMTPDFATDEDESETDGNTDCNGYDDPTFEPIATDATDATLVSGGVKEKMSLPLTLESESYGSLDL